MNVWCKTSSRHSKPPTTTYSYTVYICTYTRICTLHNILLSLCFCLCCFYFSLAMSLTHSYHHPRKTKPSQPTNQVNHPSYSHQTHVHSMRYKTSLHLICLVLLHSIAHSWSNVWLLLPFFNCGEIEADRMESNSRLTSRVSICWCFYAILAGWGEECSNARDCMFPHILSARTRWRRELRTSSWWL